MRRVYLIALSLLLLFSTGCAVHSLQNNGVVLVSAKTGDNVTHMTSIGSRHATEETKADQIETTASADITSESTDSIGEDTAKIENNIDGAVYWVASGSVWHTSISCSSLARSKLIMQGTNDEAMQAGKLRPCKICSK